MPLDENSHNRQYGFAERWLRRIFVEDWSLKLLALAITLVLWFFVTGHGSEREVAVEPRLEGKPAPSYEVREIVVTPNKVRVRGSADKVNALLSAPTQAISIEGRRESFDAPQTTINISDPAVDVLDTVNVHVSIVATGTSKLKSRETN
jgi:hypothetical protein